MQKRASGILMPVRSLPSIHGIGDVWRPAFDFVDFLSECGQSWWQVLPVLAHPLSGISPYSSVSAFAGNTHLISLEKLAEDGFISKKDAVEKKKFPASSIDYQAVDKIKAKICARAFSFFQNKKIQKDEHERFCFENSWWLEDFSLFVALREHFNGKLWCDWPEELRDRKEDAMKSVKEKMKDRIEKAKFLQYVFFRQWDALKAYSLSRGVSVFGDMPIYVDYDSADVWSHPELFKLDPLSKKMTAFSGAPPDYFSRTGQLWGNPVYRWDVLKESRYDWWIKRIEHNLRLYDLLRIDHFRGFIAYWEVPSNEKTAVNGKWIEAPAQDFFDVLKSRFSPLPLVAEDLGHITQDVRDIMNLFGFPGMKVLLFAFNDDFSKNPYPPHRHIENCVVYTGTHDNNTVKGWFENEVSEKIKKRFFRYVGREIGPSDVHREFLRMAMMSVARLVILPLQDVLGLGEKARVNRPATLDGNWKWRLSPGQITPKVKKMLRDMTEIYGRKG